MAATYLVAADGAHSTVRERLGIEMTGRGRFADCVTIYFKADVRDLIGERNLSVVYVNNPALLGFFRFAITGDSGFLAVFSTTAPDGTPDRQVGRDTSERRCVDLVRTALGAPGLPVEIESVQRWDATAGCAVRYRAGRVFLAGDAAHVMPPTGGFGGNTGIADAHNLAWKLAMTLDGSAGPGLLDSYEVERAPIGALTVEQAYTRYVRRVDPSLSSDDLAAQVDDPLIELGAVYGSGLELEDPGEPTGRVGTRAPHLPVELAGSTVSTVDLMGPGFTLLAAPEGEAWCRAAGEAAGELGIPLSTHRLAESGSVVDPTGRFAATYGLSPAGAVLIRPDGVLAWRGDRPTPTARDELHTALTAILDRG